MKLTYLQTKEKKKLQKQIHKHLDNIYNTAKTICNKWETKLIPLTTIDEIISKATINTEDEAKEMIELYNEFNTTLKSLNKALKTIAKSMQSTKVPLTEVKKGIDLIKQNIQ